MNGPTTGPEHYAEAERLAEDVVRLDGHPDPEVSAELTSNTVRLAQVHATLALAAATALPTVVKYMGDDQTVTDWANAIGHERGGRPRGDT